MNLKLKFSGQQAHEEVPTVALYLLDKSGRVHEKLAASKDGSLNLTQARDTRARSWRSVPTWPTSRTCPSNL